MGFTDARAVERAPNSIGAQHIKNPAYVDCSDSTESARRDLDFFFRAKEVWCNPKQYTLALIKPDAVANDKAQEIVNRIVYEGFVVREQQQLRLTKEGAEQFYDEDKGGDYFDSLIAFMTSGDVVALKLEREDAVNKWRSVMGSADFEEARKESPQSVRAMFATSSISNAVHGSDSNESAKRELDFFFAQ